MDRDFDGLDYVPDELKDYLKPGFFLAILIYFLVGTWFVHNQPTALPPVFAAVIASGVGAWMQRRRIRPLTNARALPKRPGPLAGTTVHWVFFFLFGIVLIMVSTLIPTGFEEYLKYNVLGLSYPAAAAWSGAMVALLAWQFWSIGKDAFEPSPVEDAVRDESLVATAWSGASEPPSVMGEEFPKPLSASPANVDIGSV